MPIFGVFYAFSGLAEKQCTKPKILALLELEFSRVTTCGNVTVYSSILVKHKSMKSSKIGTLMKNSTYKKGLWKCFPLKLVAIIQFKLFGTSHYLCTL